MQRTQAENQSRMSLRFFSSKREKRFLGNASFFGLRYLSNLLPLSSRLFPVLASLNFLEGIKDLGERNFLGMFSNAFGIIGRMMLFTKEIPPSECAIELASPAIGLASLLQALREGKDLIMHGFDSHTALNMLMELINAASLFKDPTNENAMLFLTMANLAFCVYSFTQQKENERRQEITSSRVQHGL